MVRMDLCTSLIEPVQILIVLIIEVADALELPMLLRTEWSKMSVGW
jgi:hypothetical protein